MRRAAIALVTTALLYPFTTLTRPALVGVSVSSSPDPVIRVKNTTGNEVTFKVKNTGTIDTRYSSTCRASGNVAAITVCPYPGLIAAGDSRDLDATFSTGAAGTGS